MTNKDDKINIKVSLNDCTELVIENKVIEFDVDKVNTDNGLIDVIGEDNYSKVLEYLKNKCILEDEVILHSLEILNKQVLDMDFIIVGLGDTYNRLMKFTKCKVILDSNGQEIVPSTKLKQEIIIQLRKQIESGVSLSRIKGITVNTANTPFRTSPYEIVFEKDNSNSKHTFGLFSLIIGLLVFSFFVYMFDWDRKPIDEVNLYTEFQQNLDSGLVDSVDILNNGRYFKAYLKDESGNVSKTPTWYFSPDYDDFKKDLALQGVKIKTSFSLKAKLITFVSTSSGLLFLLVILYVSKKQLDMMDIKGLDSDLETSKDKVTFDDIAGIDGIVDDIKVTIDSFLHPEKVVALGGRTCRGILLEGSPGTGKTLLAKAIANSMGANFIGLSGGDFNQIFMGAGSRKVNKVFNEAKKLEPCVIFIDEIDAIGSKRGGSNDHKEYSNTLNTLLAKMDGVSSKHRILVVGATNLASSLDEALLRSGRFDKIYTMLGSTSSNSRREIIKLHLSNKQVNSNIKDMEEFLNSLTKVFSGLSPADISSILSESVITSFNQGKNGILDFECIDKTLTKHLTRGVEEVNQGKQQEIVAIHESGHILLGLLVNKELLKGTIVGSTSGIGGFALFNEETRSIKSKSELETDILISLGGLASTELLLGEKYEGASSDLQQVTSIVTNMLYNLGLGDNVKGSRNSLTDKDLSVIDTTIDKYYNKAYGLLSENVELLKYLANLLMDKGTIYNLTLKDLKEGLYDE